MPRSLISEQDIQDIRDSPDGIVKTSSRYGIGPLRVQAMREADSLAAAVAIEARAGGLDDGAGPPPPPIGNPMEDLPEAQVVEPPGDSRAAKEKPEKPAKNPAIPRSRLEINDGYEETTKLVAHFLATPFNATLGMQLSFQYGRQTGFNGTFGQWLDLCAWAFWEHRGYDIFPDPVPLLSVAKKGGTDNVNGAKNNGAKSNGAKAEAKETSPEDAEARLAAVVANAVVLAMAQIDSQKKEASYAQRGAEEVGAGVAQGAEAQPGGTGESGGPGASSGEGPPG